MKGTKWQILHITKLRAFTAFLYNKNVMIKYGFQTTDSVLVFTLGGTTTVHCL